MAGLVAGCVGWWWWDRPRNPEELYQRRCSNCHQLQDIGGYRREDMRAIVKTMRERNGAADVIDQEEAEIIIRHLEERARP